MTVINVYNGSNFETVISWLYVGTRKYRFDFVQQSYTYKHFLLASVSELLGVSLKLM